jgi:hypothetical protein
MTGGNVAKLTAILVEHSIKKCEALGGDRIPAKPFVQRRRYPGRGAG